MGEHSYGLPNILWDKHSTSKIRIGKFCSIAKNVCIHNGSNHNVNWISTYPHRIMLDMEGKYEDGHPSSKGDVVIGNDVWIGENCTIFSGITIGDGAVIAGDSVVVKDVEPYTIYGGAPAKFIKNRFSDDVIKNLLVIKWWDWKLSKIKKVVPLLCSENVEEFIEKHG
jgi:acetyltransferase-like isoleucine patch superfamily enzyme